MYVLSDCVLWTDVFQGLLIVVCVLLAFLIVANAGGGFITIHEKIMQIASGHFARAGANGSVTVAYHFGYILLYVLFCTNSANIPTLLRCR